MKHPDHHVSTVGEFVTALRETAQDGLVWFRGQKRADWPLLPNIARPTPARPDGSMDLEIPALKRFKQNAGAFLQRLPQDEWEWIFLMQHHRGLTRLLDWTESPLVALYFALDDCEDDVEGVVWCLDPISLNIHAGQKRSHEKDILAFGIDESLDNYRPERVGERGVIMPPIAAIGPRNSSRMIAQSGTFTIIHSEPIPIERVQDGEHVWRLLIAPDAKASLRSELKLLGFNEFMLFPDLERLAIHAEELLQ